MKLKLVFQSSPVPKDGCNVPTAAEMNTRVLFQSSPVPKDGCNSVKIFSGTVLEGFQSSPVPKDGCNVGLAAVLPPGSSFNPHPSRRTGATAINQS